jgi:hypothetical protein
VHAVQEDARAPRHVLGVPPLRRQAQAVRRMRAGAGTREVRLAAEAVVVRLALVWPTPLSETAFWSRERIAPRSEQVGNPHLGVHRVPSPARTRPVLHRRRRLLACRSRRSPPLSKAPPRLHRCPSRCARASTAVTISYCLALPASVAAITIVTVIETSNEHVRQGRSETGRRMCLQGGRGLLYCRYVR